MDKDVIGSDFLGELDIDLTNEDELKKLNSHRDSNVVNSDSESSGSDSDSSGSDSDSDSDSNTGTYAFYIYIYA